MIHFLFPWGEKFQLASPGCFVWWNRDSINLELLSSGTLLNAGRSSILPENLDLSPPFIFWKFPRLLNFSTHPKIVVCATRVFWNLAWEFLVACVMCVRAYQARHLILSWMVRAETSIFLIVIYDGKMHSTFSKERTCKYLMTWIVQFLYFKNWIPAN